MGSERNKPKAAPVPPPITERWFEVERARVVRLKASAAISWQPEDLATIDSAEAVTFLRTLHDSIRALRTGDGKWRVIDHDGSLVLEVWGKV